MAKPTYQDAKLILQMAQWGSSPGMDNAKSWVWSDEFIPDYMRILKLWRKPKKCNTATA